MDTQAAQARETTAPFGQRWARRLDTRPETRGKVPTSALRELGDVDLAVYRAVAATPTPTLDEPVRRLSDAADRSRLWLAVAAAMATLGGRPGRRAAGAGLLAIAVDSAVVNGILKAVARRGRPDRESAEVPADRRVRMPASRSWPSGHAASGFAFANAVGHSLPAAALPLRMLASAVGFSRVHTGVHYSGDVVTGAVVGATVGEAVGWGLWRGARGAPALPRFAAGDVVTALAGAGRRLTATTALLFTGAAAVVVLLAIVGDLRRLPLELALLAAIVLGAWFCVTRAGWRRRLAAVAAIAGAAGLVAVSFGGADLGTVLVRVSAVALALVLVALAARRDARALRRAPTPGVAVPGTRNAVLILNPRSGGGKAERLDLAAQCRARGIEPVVLGPGDDLLALAEAAVTRGADVIGIAGGDGSQGLVAAVAARHGVAMVVVPAGTRNHLALDLGLDRTDVIGALDAFGPAVERAVDLGEVNGRVFVNNVSLGLYAEIIRSPEYRDAKVDATLNALPRVLGPGSSPFDLQFTGPPGERHTGAHIVQVSNNPYGATAGSRSTRPRLDTGRLGVIALDIRGDRGATAFLAAAAAGRPDRCPGYVAWEPSAFQVDSANPVDIGIDGEALRMAPPLRFTIRPGALRIRLPEGALGLSPAARDVRAREALREFRSAASGRSGSRP